MKQLHAFMYAIAAMFVVAGLCRCAHAAEQDPPSPDQIHNLYVIAIGETGQGVPEKSPKVYRMSSASLCEIVNRDPNCGVHGVQIADAVLYDEDLNFTKATDSAILAHEFVHYIQWVKHGRAKTCEERADREAEAYKIQARILSKVNVYYPLPQRMHCE